MAPAKAAADLVTSAKVLSTTLCTKPWHADVDLCHWAGKLKLLHHDGASRRVMASELPAVVFNWRLSKNMVLVLVSYWLTLTQTATSLAVAVTRQQSKRPRRRRRAGGDWIALA